MRNPVQTRLIATILLVLGITVAAFWFASSLNEFAVAQEFINTYGYLTVLIIAIIAGLNAIVPVPAATFVPVFSAAGLYLPFIVALLVIGTTIADLVGYWLGRASKDYVEEHYPIFHLRLHSLHTKYTHWVLPTVAAYAAVIPLPNEFILIPLAMMGCNIRALIAALIIGNTINQTALAYGFENIFTMFF